MLTVSRVREMERQVELIDKNIEGCYWSINPESGDTAGWYGHAFDPISNTSGWGEWRPFDDRKTALLRRLWGTP
jgi:endoglucanase